MINLRENQVVPAILGIYNRIKTYRPYISPETRNEMVQKKMFEDHGLRVTGEDLAKIVEVQERLASTIIRQKRAPLKEASREPNERKRERFSINVQDASSNKKPGFKFQEISITKFQQGARKPTRLPRFSFTLDQTSEEIRSQPTKISFVSSKIPRPNFQVGVRQNRSASNDESSRDDDTLVSTASSRQPTGKSIYERLYESRTKPCPRSVERVRRMRERSKPPQTPKRPPKSQLCTAGEPPHKKGRYSQACLGGQLSRSVFDRLYAERKQLNTKRLTDAQKRELYLKQQRRRATRKSGVRGSVKSFGSKESCECGCEGPADSPTSDFDMCEFLGSDSDISEVLEATLTDKNDSAIDVRKADGNIFNSTSNDGCDDAKVESLLESLAMRFNENMSLCPIDTSLLDD